MEPTPGGTLEELNTLMLDPAVQIVARLAKGPIGAQDEAMTLATLVEADFPGYAPIVLTRDLDGAFEDTGFATMAPQRLTWEAGVIVTPQALTHLYFTKTYNGAGNSLMSGIPFDYPITVAKQGQQIEFEATVTGYKID